MVTTGVFTSHKLLFVFVVVIVVVWVYIAKDLLRKMLCVDTTSRYTARMILDDPWFTVSQEVIPCLTLLQSTCIHSILCQFNYCITNYIFVG